MVPEAMKGQTGIMFNRCTHIVSVLAVLFLGILFTSCIQADYNAFDVCNEGLAKPAFTGIVLDTWTDDLPQRTSLCVSWVAPHQVILRHGEQSVELGELTRQFPDAPIETMVIRTGKDYILIGRIDETIRLPEYISFDHGGEKKAGVLDGKTSDPLERVFVMPIYADELATWETIEYIFIHAWYSREPVWWKHYEPPIDIIELAIDVPPLDN